METKRLMQRVTFLGLVPVLALTQGCPGVSESGTLSLNGVVSFASDRRTQATFGEIANRATVSLIDTTTNTTVATTVTDESGAFNMSFLSRFRPASYPYVMEAVKGLSNNTAGNDAARVRTFVQWVNGGATSITSSIPGSGIYIGRATTALCVIQSLRVNGGPSVDPTSLIGSVARGTPDSSIEPPTDDTFAPGTSGISQTEYHTVYRFVAESVAADKDPVAVIIRTGTSSYALTDKYPIISGFVPLSAAPGTQVTLNGINFDPVAASNSVTFTGTASPAVVVSGSTSSLTVRIPAGAVSGNVRVSNSFGLGPPAPFTVLPPLPGAFTGN